MDYVMIVMIVIMMLMMSIMVAIMVAISMILISTFTKGLKYRYKVDVT